MTARPRVEVLLDGGPRDGELLAIPSPLPTVVVVPRAINLERLEALQDVERLSTVITEAEEVLIAAHRLAARYGIPTPPEELERLEATHRRLQAARRRWDSLVLGRFSTLAHRYHLERIHRGRWVYRYDGPEYPGENPGDRGG